MRIDLNAAALSQLATGQSANQVQSPKHGPVDVGSPVRSVARPEDTATLSAGSLAHASLTAAALQSPAIRQDKVDALSQAVHSGSYEINPSKIADAIVSDRVR